MHPLPLTETVVNYFTIKSREDIRFILQRKPKIGPQLVFSGILSNSLKMLSGGRSIDLEQQKRKNISKAEI